MNIQTKVTYNNGLSFKLLKSNDKKLNLHLLSSKYYSSLYSNESIPALILANGNIGEFLEEDNIHTFASLDLGLTWKVVAKQASTFSASLYGNFLVLVQENELTKQMQLSMDQGYTF